MEEIEITEISILDSGELRITPIVNWNDLFQFIYRTATGVVWSDSSKSFMSPAPRERSSFDWYKNIVGSVVSEMGVLLTITPDTKWHNVPRELQQEMEGYVPGSNT